MVQNQAIPRTRALIEKGYVGHDRALRKKGQECRDLPVSVKDIAAPYESHCCLLGRAIGN